MTTANLLVGPSPLRDVIDPQFYQNNFPAEVYIKTELGVKLDKGKLDDPSFLTLTA
jgi:cleavage and polyadenylation specificity factor subunit 4